jgi:cytochrome c553
MKQLMPLLFTAALMAMSLPAKVSAAGDAAAGQTKSATCVGCHGTDGNSLVPNFPKIAGQHEGYIIKSLTDYKAGDRVNATMNGIASTLSEQDILDLAAFYSSQEVTIGAAAPDKVELGESIYRAGNPASGVSACAACHGPVGNGNPMANFPSLQGQHAMYTAEQLRHFRSGQRANDAGAMMRGVAGKMTDAEIDAVAEYIQGLH